MPVNGPREKIAWPGVMKKWNRPSSSAMPKMSGEVRKRVVSGTRARKSASSKSAANMKARASLVSN